MARPLLDAAAAEPESLLSRMGTTPQGLTAEEAAVRLRAVGPNLVAHERGQSLFAELVGRARNPLNFLLLSLAAVSFSLGDRRAAAVITVMVLLSVTLAFVQEHQSNNAAARLRTMVRTTATVLRCGADTGAESHGLEIPIEELVPGDVVRLSAGDMIPADLRVLTAKDLFLNEAALTGEAMPVEKSAAPFESRSLPNICFMGSNVLSGAGTAVVIQTGTHTYFGELAGMLIRQRAPTSFDKGVTRFTWLMIRFIAVMVPSVFVINGLTKGDWLEALMFALAVAVGLTPEMLPMIVTVNLAKGALAMSRKRVIVKRLNAIQNFGAMDVLCTDKTCMDANQPGCSNTLISTAIFNPVSSRLPRAPFRKNRRAAIREQRTDPDDDPRGQRRRAPALFSTGTSARFCAAAGHLLDSGVCDHPRLLRTGAFGQELVRAALGALGQPCAACPAYSL
jgi:Mg2+-importing ATPase